MSQFPVPNPPNPVPQPAGTGYANAQTAYHVVCEAMHDACYLDLAEDPGSDELALYLPRLNELINTEQTQGLKLWLQEDVSFTPVQSQQTYAIGPAGDIVMPRPTRIIEAYFMLPVAQVGGQQVIYPLIPLSRNEWDMLGTRNPPGITNSYFVDKQQNQLNLNLWLNPDAYTASATVHLICQVQVNQIISVTDSMNFPIEWFSYLHWALADEISTGQPAAVQAKCQMMRQFYWQKLWSFDVEDTSTALQVDPQMAYGTGSRFS